MALKLSLEGTSPGSGILTVQGAGVAPGPIQLAIQRNQDEQYLTSPGKWQSTPFWHTIDQVGGDSDKLLAEIGPQIIDGIISAAGMMFFVTLKTGSYQGQQVLKIAGRLLGSEAAGQIETERNVAAAPVTPAPVPEPEPEVEEVVIIPETIPDPIPEPPVSIEESEPELEPAELIPERPEPVISEPLDEAFDEDDEPEQADEKPGILKRFWYIWLFLILLAALVAAIYLWWNTPWQGSETLTVGESEKSEVSSDSSATGLRGRARASAYLDQQPRPDADQIVAEAQRWGEGNDCEGVNILLNMAAGTSSKAALSLAQLYDSSVEPQRPCSRDDPETAAYWYEMPASEGNSRAQARLGEILTRQNASGPLYDKGVQFLRQAARNGEQSASEQLKALGE